MIKTQKRDERKIPKMKRIVIDTETTNSLDEPLTYDIGWAVVDEDGSVVKTESYAVAEIFLDKELMTSAYFAEKIPQYWDEIKNGERKLARFKTICMSLRKDCELFRVSEIYAHNARFDDLALKLTQRFLTGSKYRYFFPENTIVCDTLKMSYKAFGKDEQYKEFCEKNNYKTKNGRLKMTAEIIYRFLTNNNEFVEKHKGIDDVLIEKDILIECLKRGIENGALYE
jgi:hypothetical protein